MTHPTGVFVRLPLSDEQKAVFYDIVSKGSATNTILAIGTHVTSDELYPVGYINEDAIGGLACGIYQSASIFRDKDAEHHDDVALTRMSVALAKLAEKDAEIARKDEEIERLWSSLEDIEMGIDALPDDNEDYSRMTAREMQRQALEVVKAEVKALKGGAA